MSYQSALLAVSLLILPIAGHSDAASHAANPDSVFSLSVEHDEEGVGLELTWAIAPGYYLYRDRITATLDGRSVRLATPRSVSKESDSPGSGFREVYRGIAMADTIGEQLPEQGELVVTYEGCGQNAICYPPIHKAIDLATLSSRTFVSDESTTSCKTVAQRSSED
jgi:thiol:disulfide interchange protein DsbD